MILIGILDKIIRNKFRKNEDHQVGSAQQEYAEKRQIVDEILEQMNEKEAAIKQGELE